MERVERVEDLDMPVLRAQGIVGVDGTTRTCIAWCRPEDWPSTDHDGYPAGRSISCPSRS